MHSQVFLGDCARNRHRIKDFHEHIVYFNVEPLQDFIPKSERLSHVSRLMIAPEHDHVPWEVQLNSEEQDTHFNAKDSSVNIVTKEEVVETTRLPSLADHIEQVCVLSMDISDDTDWLFNLNKILFSREQCEYAREDSH